MFSYPAILAVLSLCVLTLEAISPRSPRSIFRKNMLGDVLFLVFNGHFVGFLLSWLAGVLWGPVAPLLAPLLLPVEALHLAAPLPWAAQALLALVLGDFLQWCVHNALHRVPWLWRFHTIHHGVQDDEMDWIVSFRFHWFESVVYKTAQALPLLAFGFDGGALLAVAAFGTLWGHLNHANLNLGPLDWSRTPLRYVLNSAAMHRWHHDADAPLPGNYGVVLSCWDWIFGTARWPPGAPRRLGYAGDDTCPRGFWRALLPPP